MLSRPAHPAVVLVILLFASTARASMFGEENVTLGAMLANALKQTQHMVSTYKTIKEGISYARETVGYAQDAVAVVRNIELIAQDPKGYLAANARQFANSFPEVRELTTDVARLRLSISHRGNSAYNPYVFKKALDDLAKKGGVYDVVIRAVDKWGETERHDEVIEALHKQKEATARLLTRVNAAVTPQQAMAYTAQASAIEAEAAVLGATYQAQLLNLMKLRLLADLDAAAQARVEVADANRETPAILPDTWSLPLGTPERQP